MQYLSVTTDRTSCYHWALQNTEMGLNILRALYCNRWYKWFCLKLKHSIQVLCCSTTWFALWCSWQNRDFRSSQFIWAHSKRRGPVLVHFFQHDITRIVGFSFITGQTVKSVCGAEAWPQYIAFGRVWALTCAGEEVKRSLLEAFLNRNISIF